MKGEDDICFWGLDGNFECGFFVLKRRGEKGEKGEKRRQKREKMKGTSSY